jgi:tetratricopeptide (TPR) repeat protein
MRKEEFNEGWNAFLEVFVDLVGAYLAKDDVKNAERIEREACHYSNRISQIYLMLGNWYTGKNNDKARDYFEIAIDICKTEGSLYDSLLVSNAKAVLPEILNWLATYYFERGDSDKAGECMNMGIRLNNNRLPIRWDIFNATKETRERLIKT